MKILIIDDHALFRVGLRMLLSAIGTHVTVVEVASVDEGLQALDADPDLQICLLDLGLRDENGLQAIQRIKELAPWISVVIVSGNDDNATIRRCLDAGAMSFVPKSVPPDVLTEALLHVLGGTIYLPQSIRDASIATFEPPGLTRRQTQVLRCLSRGLPTKLISRELGLSEHTIKDHISALFQALEARNRTDVVIKASGLGLLPAGLAADE